MDDREVKVIHTEKFSYGNDICGKSPVEIIVPFHGQYESVSRLITSIYQTTFSNPFRLVLVDDASPANFSNQLEEEVKQKKIQNLVIVRNEKQMGFGGSLHEGYKRTEFDWICFLQSDCLIEDVNWLKAMFETYHANRKEGVKFVSARTNNPTGGDPRVRGDRHQRADDTVLSPESLATIIEKDCYVPLVATFCHRQLFEKIGFIRDYPYAMYEDIEFSCRMHCHGFKQAISGASYVRHDAGKTINSLAGKSEIAHEIDKNRERLIADVKSMKNSANRNK